MNRKTGLNAVRYAFVCHSHNAAASTANYIEPNNRLFNKWRPIKNTGGSDRGLFQGTRSIFA